MRIVVKNVVQINLLAATTKCCDATDQIYNVALNNETSLITLYKMIEDRVLLKNSDLKPKKPIFRDFRIGDVRHSKADIKKAKKLLNYDPKYLISDGLDESIPWYVKNL